MNPAGVNLTVVIPTFNEAENLPELLAQLDWVGEVIVIDSYSTDITPELARAAGAKFLQRKLDTLGLQKNYAIERASHPWVLIIDADERLTPALAEEIRTTVEHNDPNVVGYEVYRQNFFLDKPISYGGLQRDKVIRLIRRGELAYDNKQVHESIRSDKPTGRLNNKLQHYTYRGLSHYIQKNEKYALWSADDHAARTSRVGVYHLLFKPVWRFFTQYILKMGFRDGRAGLIFCAVASWGVFLRYAFLVEREANG